MISIIVGQQNIFAYDWSVTDGVGTLTITGDTAIDLGLTSIVRIEDTTQDTVFRPTSTTTFSDSYDSGKPTYTWVFNTLPAGTLTADTLLIYIDVTDEQGAYLALQKLANA